MPRSSSIEVSVEAHEIVTASRRLNLKASAALDPQSALGAFALQGHPATVRLSKDCRAASLEVEGDLPTGPQTLRIGELRSSRGSMVAPAREVPFFVSDSRASISPALRIESMVRLQVEPLKATRVSAAERPKGSYIEIMKAVNRKTGKPVQLAFDQRGKRINANAVFEGIARRRLAKYGKLHPALKAAADDCRANQTLPVAVWLEVPETRLPAKRTDGPTLRPPKEEVERRSHACNIAERFMASLNEYEAQNVRLDPHVPVVYCKLTAAQLAKVQKDEDVLAVFLHEKGGKLDLNNSMSIAQSDKVQSTLGLTGKGVNVAVYEDGPDNTSNLSITAAFLSNPATSSHSRHTHGIIKNIEANRPHGHAPGCNLHSANSMDLSAISWAAQTRGCTVISQSFHRNSEQTSSGLSFDDMFKDNLALHWPYPTILHAAGNGAVTEFVNHKGFNTLAIGNHDDTASAMSSSSVFRNPASAHSDRELPELAANGTSVTTVGLTLSGTSMAAPAAAGCTALMQQASGTLKSWPEGCRAILLAGATRNVTGNTWWVDRVAGVDASDGSGAVDALESVRIARARSSRNNAGVRRGWDVGTLRSADIGRNGETTFSYKVTVPRFTFNARVKVALAWDSHASVTNFLFFQIATDVLELDLDLKVYDSSGALVGYSGSWDNSYEVAEFAARSGETYTIKIRRWSGTADVWYGLAWTVQGFSFLRPDWDLTVVQRARGR
jgi:subtilase family protein